MPINYQHRVNQRPIGNEVLISNEPHTIGITSLSSTFIGEIRLLEVPLQELVSSIVIPGYTEVTISDPGSTEFLVDYISGRITFNIAANGLPVFVTYKGRGSVVDADDINELQTPVGIALNIDGSISTGVVKPAAISTAPTDNFAFPNNISVAGNSGVTGNSTVGGTLAVTGTASFAGGSSNGTLDMTSHKILDVANPTTDTDAANKLYVDSVAQGLNIHDPADYATTGALPTVTPAGTKATHTLTATAFGVLSIDGNTSWYDIANDGSDNNHLEPLGAGPGFRASRVLIKNQADPKDNGIYAVQDKGSVSTPFILVRYEDFNGVPVGEVATGDYIFVSLGFSNSTSSWVVTSGTGTINVDVDATGIAWSQFAAGAVLTAGSGISIVGSTISVKLDGGTISESASGIKTTTGLVNSGTQYQMSYYATTGTGISGSSTIATDSSGNLNITRNVNGGFDGITILNTNSTAGQIREANLNITGDNGSTNLRLVSGKDNTDTQYSLVAATGQLVLATVGLAALTFDTSQNAIFSKSVTVGSGFNLNMSGSAQFIAPIGSATLPGIAWNGNTNTGLYSSASDQISFATGGIGRLTITDSVISSNSPYLAPNGSSSVPAYSFTTEISSGLYFLGTGHLGITCAGTEIIDINGSAGTLYLNSQVLTNSGSATTPSISFNGDPNTGIYSGTADHVQISTAGVTALNIDNVQGATFAAVVNAPNRKYQVGGNQLYPIVQIQAYTTSTGFTTTSSGTQITASQVTIIPKFNTSRILIIAEGVAEVDAANTPVLVYLFRNNSVQLNSTRLLRIDGVSGLTHLYTPCYVSFYDNPATTSAITYSVNVGNANGSTVVGYGTGGTTTITAIEIAQ